MSDSTSNEPPKKIPCSLKWGPELSSKPVLIRVGASKQEHYVHEKLLRTNSIFFDNALKKDWKEGQDRVIDLVEISELTFSIWATRLYTGRMLPTKPTDSQKKAGKVSVGYQLPHWAACYALGDYLQDLDFKDAVIDWAIEAMFHIGCVPRDLASSIYPHSTTTSAHRKLVVDVFVKVVARDSWQKYGQHPVEFLFDVIKSIGPVLDGGLWRRNVKEVFNLNNTCDYHDHGADKPCYKKKPEFGF